MSIEKIWEEYQAALKAFLHARISSPDDVDDLLQDILLKTYQNFHTVKSQSSIKSWLFQVANHVIIDFYRDKSKSANPNPEDLWFDENNTDIKQDLSRCIAPFINALPEDAAELLTAIDIQGQSQKEYAEVLGISYSTLKSRVQKGRGQLRQLFEDCCHLTLDKHGNVIGFDPKSRDCKNC